MDLMIAVALALVITASTVVRSDPDVDRNHDDLKSAEARQKIYDIISSHEDRKYGDHGGHEYEEGEVPKRSSSRKSKIYGYLPNEGEYYYEDKPQKSDIVYQPKTAYADKPYSVPVEVAYHAPKEYYPAPKEQYPAPKEHYPTQKEHYPAPKEHYPTQKEHYVVPKEYYPAPKEHYPTPKEHYPAPKEHYPVVETVYALPKRGYITRDNAETIRKRQNPAYIVPKSPKGSDYQDGYGSYVENKNAPITIGQTARTVYASPIRNTQYAVLDPKAPSEYISLDGQKPKPMILDPKLKATYHLSQPEAHYSSPEHQVIKSEVPVPAYKAAYVSQPVVHYSAPEHHAVIQPEISAPVHYASPAKKYAYFDDHKVGDGGHHASGHHAADHHAAGHGYHKDNAVKKESGHKSHGQHDIAGHKSHSSSGGHHDEHDRHHNRGLYERDRGYHYEKAYAYDRVRAHHDIGSNKGSHSSYGAHHGQEAHKDAGHHGAEAHSYFKKDDHGSGYGYKDGNSLYKKGHNYEQKQVPVYYHG